MLFIKSNIETTWWATEILPYNSGKTLAIYAQNPLSIPIKRITMRFISKILMSSYVMRQLAKQEQLDDKNTYIQAMLQKSEKLAAKVDILKFENKRFIEALKIEKQKRNKGKKVEPIR